MKAIGRLATLGRVASLGMLTALVGCSVAATSNPSKASEGESVSVSAASLSDGSVVDGIRVGEPIDCVGPDCAIRIELAEEAAMSRHGVPSSALGAPNFYLPHIPAGAALGTGGGSIVVFDVDDGSMVAVHTYCFSDCFVVEVQPVPSLKAGVGNDHGPLVDPLVDSPVGCSTTEQPACDEAVQVAIAAATRDGFLAKGDDRTTHYYVTYFAPDSSEAEALQAEYLVNFYVAGDHGPIHETAIAVDCSAGSCVRVPSKH